MNYLSVKPRMRMGASRASLPFTIDLVKTNKVDFIAYYRNHEQMIGNLLLRNGAVKFRGVPIDSLDDFQEIINAISTKFLSYVDGNSPRTKLSQNVYTSTEYDPTQKITMHNELSYSAHWPNTLFFSCLIPACTGGETLLADSRMILREMDTDIVQEIEKRGITYIRNLHSGIGVGPSWQETFETSDRRQLEHHCGQLGIRYEWTDQDNLRLYQSARGILEHRLTGESVWFNQIDQFHPCHLGEEMYELMSTIYDSPEEFPLYVRFSDGKEIGEDLIREILRTIETQTVAPEWKENELLVVDNVLVSHGRNAFTGERKVLVSMSE